MSDEFYIIANREIPDYDSYEGFLQFEDGVGMIRKLGTEIENYLDELPDDYDVREKTVSIATGKSAYEFINSMAELIMKKFPQVKINVYRIVNEFWGETITVSGLITAQDIIKQTEGKERGETLYITRSMLKADELIFLDDVTLEQLEEILGNEVVPCENEGHDFVDKILKYVYRIVNEFWGETITVSGLITAQDIIKQTEGKERGETLYITRSMLKADELIFLDDVTLEQLEEILGNEVVPCENEGHDFVDKILK